MSLSADINPDGTTPGGGSLREFQKGSENTVKIITAQQAAALLKDGDTLGIGGFGAYGNPDELYKAIGRRYQAEQHPKDLTLVAGICSGDNRMGENGVNPLSDPGMLKTVIAAHMANSPKLSRLVGDDQIAGYMLPLGVVAHLLRAISGRKPGVLTQVGLNTFADPRVEGCRVNGKAVEQGRNVVELVEIDGEKQLFYPAFPIDVCLIRGTYADEDGNISIEHEALTGLEMEMAAAVHNSGGIVIVQVKDVVERGSIHPRRVRIHSAMVDYVVKAEPENHVQCYALDRECLELCGEVRRPVDAIPPMPLGIRKVIARRGAMELCPDVVINLGIGIPSGVGSVANEEGMASRTTLSLESGPIGGVPLEGSSFAASVNPEAINALCDTFDFYDGGLLDMTFLGAAEIDREGNVNVSRFGNRCIGPGGFINISQNTPKVCFMCSFTAGKSAIQVADGKLNIAQDGSGIKFIKKVQQITFSADYARKTGQQVTYITERGVFRLADEGIELVEIAPGVDLEKDILAHMEFKPLIAKDLKVMDERIFREEKMGLHF